MSVELLYTSAAQGLKQGSRGFCTVLSTAGMPINLATRLEGLSAYRHQFPPNHPDANQNPVCFSHLRFSIGGRLVSILSRISDYGIDYSQRTNKLAHHIVLDAHELTPAGPAWLMEHGKIFRDAWSGQCETPATGPTIDMQNQSPRVCLEWGHQCGDAGWGGVVADAFARSGSKPLWIVYGLSQSHQLLRLLDESIALLPVDQRWRATFSTYATNLPPDADCKVRCVLQGTDEARLAPARGAVIDLTKSLPAAPATANVTAAREGPNLSAFAATPAYAPTSKDLSIASHSQPQTKPKPSLMLGESNLADDSQQFASVPNLPPAIKPKQFKRKKANLADDVSSNTPWLKWALMAASGAAALLLITTIVLLFRPTRVPPERAQHFAIEQTDQVQVIESALDAEAPSAESTNLSQAHPTGPDQPIGKPGTESGQLAQPSKEREAGTKSTATDTASSDTASSDTASSDTASSDTASSDTASSDTVEKSIEAIETNQAMQGTTAMANGSKAVVATGDAQTIPKQQTPLKGRLMADAVFQDGKIGVELIVPLENSLDGGKYHINPDGGPRAVKAAGPIDVAGSDNKKIYRVIVNSEATITVYLWLPDQKLNSVAKDIQLRTEGFGKVVIKWNELVKRANEPWALVYSINHVSNTLDEYIKGIENLRARLSELDALLAVKKTIALKGVPEPMVNKVLQKYLIPDLEAGLEELKKAERDLSTALHNLDSTAVFSTGPILHVGSTVNGQVNLKAIEADFTIEPIYPESFSQGQNESSQ